MPSTVTQRPRRSLRSRPTLWVLTLIAMIAAAPVFAAQSAHSAALAAPLPQTPGASVRTKVQVPTGMRAAPFDVDRYLNVPPNFGISVFARVGNARFMAFAPNGDLFVSQPGSGKVLAIRPTGGAPQIFTYAGGLRNPHDIVFHTIGGTTYVYIAESHQINRYVYRNGDTAAFGRQVIIGGLPDNSTPELQGKYGHQLKNIALDGNNQLYVSIASTCNACVEDTVSNPKRGAIYVYNADGTNRRLFAQGLRNAEGLAMVPGTNTLWVVVNNRDNIAYPFQRDYNGDGSNDYGTLLPGYVDNHPPEPFTSVRQGGNYGWPFCNSNPDNGLNNMPFDRDVQLNADGSRLNCDTADRVSKGIQAHSAPLGLTFLQNTAFPSAYRNGAVVGYHGSWNRTQRTGYKVAYFPWNTTTQTPGDQVDLVTGWIEGTNVWGRPVDMAVDKQGSMFISDDGSGTIYKLTYTPTATPTPTPPPATLPNGTYTLTLKASGKRLDVAGASTTNGANVWQWTPNSTCAQRWLIESLNNGYHKLTNACGNKVCYVQVHERWAAYLAPYARISSSMVWRKTMSFCA